ncbi:hypothetical protein [Caulobacter sp. 17J80-11]|uniref:hypothetical protein n=1 Tax=Caulobacter sp. 17J80-11 TaxID=2763502 RepID=UPI00165399A7|nr:hypothetical protein [Caulobacter sp. 17J80-11]MBC6983789.1 hypothetical protein [Caulobacter sp. 17J80-11]
MSALQDALRPYWLDGLNAVSTGTSRSFKGWLDGEDYVVSSFVAGSNVIELAIGDVEPVVAGFAHDIDRFGAATLETIAGIGVGNEFANSRAWPLIRSYYAAFYAAHGICRIFGRSVSSLAADNAATLRRVAVQSGFLPGHVIVHEKVYAFELDVPGRSISGAPLSRGSHEDTWRQLDDTLSSLQVRILSSPGVIVAKQEVFDCLQVARDIMRTDGASGNWLSKVRNNLNYRHDYGAWYPHGGGRHWDSVDAMFRAFLSDPLAARAAPDNKVVARFAKGCALIVAIFVDLLRDLSTRHPGSRSFLLQRSMPVLRAA